MTKKITKKMTLKEFKEAFEKAGFNFSIWGYEGILNLISCLESRYAKEYEAKGKDMLDEMSRERAVILHQILNDRGYYND